MASSVLGAKAMRIQPAPKVCMSKAKERGVPINVAGVLGSVTWLRTWSDGSSVRTSAMTAGVSSLAGDVKYRGSTENAEGGFWRVAILGDFNNSVVQVYFELVKADGSTINWSYPYFTWDKQLPAKFEGVEIPNAFGEPPLVASLYIR